MQEIKKHKQLSLDVK